MKQTITAIIAIMALATPDTGRPAEIACDAAPVTVSVENPATAQRVCDVATRALGRLAACHLPLDQPITIHIKTDLETGSVPCLALFRCNEDRIEILTPAEIANRMDESDAFFGIPPDDLFDSLIVHELAHASLFQVLEQEPLTLAATEYVSYALQLEAMSEKNRTILLARHRTGLPIMEDAINDMSLMLSPGVFAARAWLHFSAPGHGCDFVKRLIERDVKLDSQSP